ncbi:hypothetical protein L6R49_18650 [Myxococcota bacterium]|nr:hypothetical protein [Myxococcota bacterium]
MTFLTLSLVLIGCKGGDDNVDTAIDDTGEVDLAARYAAAVADASVADLDEVYDQLIAVTDANSSLDFDDQGRVLVVTWTSWDGYDGAVGTDTTVGVDVWVTTTPEVQTFCGGLDLDAEALTLRLEQRLGLPAGTGKDRFVQLRVHPDDLFRPSPDPEVTDSVASLEFPTEVSQAHKDWIDGLMSSSYGEDGYPWTRLGYTYDWAPGASEIGASEFVIRSGSTVGVDSVQSLAEYCP